MKAESILIVKETDSLTWFSLYSHCTLRSGPNCPATSDRNTRGSLFEVDTHVDCTTYRHCNINLVLKVTAILVENHRYNADYALKKCQ